MLRRDLHTVLAGIARRVKVEAQVREDAFLVVGRSFVGFAHLNVLVNRRVPLGDINEVVVNRLETYEP